MRRGATGLNALLLTLTGGLTLAPTCPGYLALSHQHRLATAGAIAGFTADQLARAASLSGICCCLPSASGCSWDLACRTLAFHPFCLARRLSRFSPALRLAGGAIAALMNAIALIASQNRKRHPVDLLLSLLAQSPGCCWAPVFSASASELNQSLQSELARAKLAVAGAVAGNERESAPGRRARTA